MIYLHIGSLVVAQMHLAHLAQHLAVALVAVRLQPDLLDRVQLQWSKASADTDQPTRISRLGSADSDQPIRISRLGSADSDQPTRIS